MTSTLKTPLPFEREHEPWRWNGLTQRCAQIPVEQIGRHRDGQTMVLWRVALHSGKRPVDIDQPGGACWDAPEATTMASGVGRVLTGVADNKPFGDVEGFFVDAQNHGLDWSTMVFQVENNGRKTSHSLLSWAVTNQNPRVVKALLGRKFSVTAPVNALDHALVALSRSSNDAKADNIARMLVEHTTPNDLNAPENWCRQGASLTSRIARYPLSILAAQINAWGLLSTMLDRGAAPNVQVEGVDSEGRPVQGQSLIALIKAQMSDGDLAGWAVHGKALALSEQELLTAEANQTSPSAESRARPRL